nr:MAG TPA: 5' nucleotidase [Caudoviricetes sp.]
MKLFIDFDNTIANSSEVIVDMLNEHFDKNENFEKLRKYDFSDLFPECSYWDIEKFFNSDEMFERLKIFPNMIETVDAFKDFFDEISIVTIGTKDNLENKKRFLKENNLELTFYGIENNGRSDKSSVDMHNGVFIDDHIGCLHSSNAKIKILMKNVENGEWNKVEPNDDIYVVNNWYEVYSIFDFIKKNKELYLWEIL